MKRKETDAHTIVSSTSAMVSHRSEQVQGHYKAATVSKGTRGTLCGVQLWSGEEGVQRLKRWKAFFVIQRMQQKDSRIPVITLSPFFFPSTDSIQRGDERRMHRNLKHVREAMKMRDATHFVWNYFSPSTRTSPEVREKALWIRAPFRQYLQTCSTS